MWYAFDFIYKVKFLILILFIWFKIMFGWFEKKLSLFAFECSSVYVPYILEYNSKNVWQNTWHKVVVGLTFTILKFLPFESRGIDLYIFFIQSHIFLSKNKGWIILAVDLNTYIYTVDCKPRCKVSYTNTINVDIYYITIIYFSFCFQNFRLIQ